ncbi:glycosyltransferase family 39 protein [Limnofasciculus baicalensis]|uniref:Glycosyltransferase family 39 protein n=1 Tax=Limnofasciculus baicalensis BBK-W-15 TaxID=2699891 RepID=A0AAE3GW22_9CYAN|nr:glycosyltransferase family 39 protein [Limnofasciculus baicalensis]MCP2731695.1 glycosyltransferase family 39 protein [Limnofasciculus baicalensis BBK-W-15]
MLKNQLIQRLNLPKTWLSFLIITVLILGIFFRLTNLDRKIYWFDETYTSLRISGYTETEIVQEFSQPKIISIQDLQYYQHLNPERSLIDTIKSLSLEDPQHPPLYYVIARFWAQWFGTSVTAMRSLPALISLLAFPSIYWLCQELFNSPVTNTSATSATPSATSATPSAAPSAAPSATNIGPVAAAILAVSPFHVLYAQEARQYSLWTVTILISNAALIRAIRLKTKRSWLIYFLTLTTSFYTFLFSGLVAIGHGIYIITIEKFCLTKTIIYYLLASLAALIIFIPWLGIVITSLSQIHKVTSWANQKNSLLKSIQTLMGVLARIFIDFNTRSRDPLIYLIPITIAILFLLIIVSYSFYFLIRHTPKRTWLFIVTLVGVPAIALIIPDLIFGGNRSTLRFLTPLILGIQLAIAYLLATKISQQREWREHKTWQIVTIILLSCGILSCAVSSQAEVWWNKHLNVSNPAIANIINQTPHPLLISDDQMAYILTFSYVLEPKVKLIIQPRCYTCNLNYLFAVKPYIPQIPDEFSDVFLYKHTPSPKWNEELKKQQIYKLQLVYNTPDDQLWKLDKQ